MDSQEGGPKTSTHELGLVHHGRNDVLGAPDTLVECPSEQLRLLGGGIPLGRRLRHSGAQPSKVGQRPDEAERPGRDERQDCAAKESVVVGCVVAVDVVLASPEMSKRNQKEKGKKKKKKRKKKEKPPKGSLFLDASPKVGGPLSLDTISIPVTVPRWRRAPHGVCNKCYRHSASARAGFSHRTVLFQQNLPIILARCTRRTTFIRRRPTLISRQL